MNEGGMYDVGISIEAAYQECEQITRSEARNFSYGIRLLPKPKRQALSAVYAVARRIDDIGDGDLPPEEKIDQLAQMRVDLHRVGEASTLRSAPEFPNDPVLVALADAAHRFPVPLGAFDDLIDGCEADAAGRRYDTFDELLLYCRQVAGSIGRLSVGVYNPLDAGWALVLGEALGVALQLTNILRDLREDSLNGRVYLPLEDLDRFGCDLAVDESGALSDPPDRLAALIRFEADRAEDWYVRGLALLPLLDHRSAACTAAMAGIYRRLLQRIAAEPQAVRTTRISLPTSEKLSVAARALARKTS